MKFCDKYKGFSLHLRCFCVDPFRMTLSKMKQKKLMYYL